MLQVAEGDHLKIAIMVELQVAEGDHLKIATMVALIDMIDSSNETVRFLSLNATFEVLDVVF